jgi:hypothetical protein
MERMSGYGHYMIKSLYKKKKIRVITTDSMIWDHLIDDDNKELQMEARKACYTLIVCEYEKNKLCK